MNVTKVLNQDAAHHHAVQFVNQDANAMMDIFVVTMVVVFDPKSVTKMNNAHLANITINVRIFVTNFTAAQILDVVFHLKKSVINL